jgi:predicted ATPase
LAVAPFLLSAETLPDRIRAGEFPFTIPALRTPLRLRFEKSVTFLVGENGSGKSTLIEAIAEKCGFNREGGNRNHEYHTRADEPSPLASAMRLSWRNKATRGFFLRAESFFNFATYLDGLEDDPLRAYGGRSLHQQSHGESFLALFQHQFRHGIFLLDEPEAALSPQRQLAFLTILHDLAQSGDAQFIIASHSPMLFSYPEAQLLAIGDGGIQPVVYTETEHYRLLKSFLDAPERYWRHLLAE